MITLDAATKSLEIDLVGIVATTQCPFVCSYVDISQATFGLTGSGETDGTTNNTTAVTVAAGPAAATSRKINYLSVVNVDTVAIVLTVQLNNNGTARTCWKGTLAVGDNLTYLDGRGFQVIDAIGQIKVGLAGVLTAIAALANAAGWLHNDGTGVFVYSTPTYTDVGALAAAGTAAKATILATTRAIYGNNFDGSAALTAVILPAYLNATIALTDGATPALDASLGHVFRLSTTTTPTIAVPSNPTSGQKIVIQFYASGGARTLALNTGANGFRFGADITALTATTSGKTDYVGCIWNATDSKWDVVAVVKGY